MSRRYTILAAVALILLGCVREEQAEDPELKTFDCFTVSVEETEMTKAHMEEGGAVKWDVGDCIGVYSDTQAPVQYWRGEDGKFYGEPVTGTKFYAFYPWSNFVVNEENPQSLKVLNTMAICRGDQARYWDFPMVAVSSGNTLAFKQVSGLLHLTIDNTEEYNALSFVAEVYNPEAGGTVDLSAKVPQIAFTPKSRISYVLSLVPTRKNEIYFALPPMTLEDGFSVTVSNDQTGGAISKYTSKSVQIKRGTILNYRFDVANEILELEEQLSLERESLVAFYQAMDGDQWLNNSNWCSDKPLGEWYGITTDASGRVIQISLVDNGLKGTIPEEIGNLKSLKILDLSTYEPNASGTAYGGNNISGALPNSLGNLTNLLDLVIQNNMISGQLPESMKKLTNLQRLVLTGRMFFDSTRMDYDYLTGSIPEWIGELANLTCLNLAINAFSGEVPNSISKLKNLVELYIGNNNLSGSLPDISKMSRIRVVNCEHNSFSIVPACYSVLLDHLADGSYGGLSIMNNQITSLPQEVTCHPFFPERAWEILLPQQSGYSIEMKSIPATKWTYDTFDGGFLDMGSLYSQSDYTMIVRWAEWCPFSQSLDPLIIRLYEEYKNKGLQVVWAYAGGVDSERISYMTENGMDQFPYHIIECHQADSFIHGTKDHAVWINWAYSVPFVEIVDRDGNIVFISDEEKAFGLYPISYSRSKLEVFLNNLLGGDLYLSTDFAADGSVHALQTATEGEGINIVLMGDAYSDRLIADGTYGQVMQKAKDAFFSEEPYKSLKDRFNVYYVDVVSKNEVYYGDTAFDTYYGEGTRVGGDDNKAIEYAKRVLTDNQMDDAVIIVMMNRDYYAGTCYMYYALDGDYGRGVSVAYFPTSSNEETFRALVSHEAGGHGFAKLDDEYAYEDYGSIPAEKVAEYKSSWPYGWWKNTDFTSDVTKVKWAKFIADERYASEYLGAYEGASTYWKGSWRPTEESIMNHNVGGFNAPSREAIYYRAMKLSEGADWEYDYETFVTFDQAARASAATSTRERARNFVERPLPPLHPPVVINHSWRDK